MSALVIRGQRVLLDGELRPAALHIDNGRITRISPYEGSTGTQTVDAGTKLVAPGVVDSHVHINEPGRTEWEGFRTATEAAAAGGITTLVDMPLNCIPATTSRAAAEAKRIELASQLHVDVAFWGGVIPGNVGELEGLARFGVPGCKCFLCPSGVDEFPHVGKDDLEEALPVLKELGLTLLVHAEAPGPLEVAEAAVEGADPRRYDTYLRSRPARAEDEAIAMVIALAKKYRARAHIVHLASGGAVELIARAQADGVAISAETCLHYLGFHDGDIPDGATHYKCAPPIRDAANREQLWKGLERGVLTQVVSDHSPCTPALKKPDTGDFVGAWGGIASLQLGLSALWTMARARGHGVAQVWRWNSEGPAQLAGLQRRKGKLAPGFDADVVIWDEEKSFVVKGEALHHRHKVTPWAGRTLQGVVEQTWVGGKLAYSAEAGLAPAQGKFLSVQQ
ncbi:MAG: allantoinase AllB [Myxococcaceae bacterium]|nr:allantoinase AllB [Myxococcaceae bacterium]